MAEVPEQLNRLYREKLIIEKASLAALSNRIGWTFVATFFWGMWVYLCLPLVTFVVWWSGCNFFDEYVLNAAPGELMDIKYLFLIYACVIVFMGSSLLIWARTEFIRFRNVRRRGKSMPAGITELAEFAQIPASTMTQLRFARQMIAHHNQHGKFLYAEIIESAKAMGDN